MVTTSVRPYVLPGAVAILFLLFIAQPLGTARIGKAFGPIMAVWFLVIAVMGAVGIIRHPGVLAAINPMFAIDYVSHGGMTGFLVLGGVFLCVTGAEALYADMGHFGPKPIRTAWLGIVFPSLVINYAGQVAIVLDGASVDGNVFYRLSPPFLLVPLVILSTVATVIASQAIITGAFSMTRQGIRLGWMPRFKVTQTSEEGYGQIYVGTVNWVLMIVTVVLTLAFKKSDNLANAYGVAVSLTMLLTTALLFIAMREIWKWSLLATIGLAGFLFLIDATFFSANLVKVADGGYVPLLLAAAVYGIMWIWHRGSTAVAQQLEHELIPVELFCAEAIERNTPRVPGTAVFLTRTSRDVPPTLAWHLERNRALHHELVVLTVNTAPIPKLEPEKHLIIKELAPNFWRAEAIFGYMEKPDIPALFSRAKEHGCHIDFDDATYYIGHAVATPKEDRSGLPTWQVSFFGLLERNSTHVIDLLRLPQEQTVEIGRQVEI